MVYDHHNALYISDIVSMIKILKLLYTVYLQIQWSSPQTLDSTVL